MMAIAKEKSVYRHLIGGDMNAGVEVADKEYDAAICIGSFAPGHLAPTCLPEIIRLVKPGALIVIFMNAVPYAAEGYEGHIRALETQGLWTVKSIETNFMICHAEPSVWGSELENIKMRLKTTIAASLFLGIGLTSSNAVSLSEVI
eukprot:gene52481-71581_t